MTFILVDDDEITYGNPLGERVTQIEDILRSSKCFVPAFVGVDPYAVGTYVDHYMRYQTQAVLLIDRNIYSDILDIAKGKQISEGAKVSAALMAFAPCASAMIEPVLAMHEGAKSGAKGGWKRNLSLFRAADNIHPLNWAMLALGESDRFSKKLRSNEEQRRHNPFNPNRKLRTFGFNYPTLLKLGILIRRGGDRNARMKEFINWMYWDWQFSAPSTLLALTVLGTNPPKKAFKAIDSADREKAVKGVWNAAWDMVYVQEWFIRAKKQSENETLHILCSRDVLMLRVADLLRNALFEEVTAEEEFKRAGFSRSVVDLYEERVMSMNSPQRRMPTIDKAFLIYRRSLVAALRAEFMKP